MSKETSPFDPNEFAEWLLQGFKEVVSYRVRQTLDRERWLQFFKSKIPNKNEVVHLALKRAFLTSGFEFEELKQGSAVFHVIRKKIRVPEHGKPMKRLVLIPGFGDTPGSWVPLFTLVQREISQSFDEIVVLDFPGYMGFLSGSEMVTSMSILLSAVKTVCEANPPDVLIGHSLGGWLAGKVAQDLSRTLDHLIVIAPSGLTPEEERKSFGDFIVRNQELSIFELLELVVYDAKKFAPLLSREFKDFYAKSGVREFVESVKPDEFIDSGAPFKAKKISVIWGDHDRFVPTHWMRHWVESYGDYLDAYLLKNTGHIPQLERPYVTAQVLMHAIQGKGGVEGRGWKKIQSRRREYEPKVTSKSKRKLLLTGA
jgi:pimeloyl-ACP methyl ester carboxylesterase